jgi:hypothetical protein
VISVSDTTAGLLAGSSWVYRVRVESWLGGQLLDADIPVEAGSEDLDRSLRIPERVTLTVPRTDRGASYAPITDDAPLAANGQRLLVRLGVGGRGTEVEWLTRGWFVVQDSDVQGDTVNVSAVGLLTLIDEARFVSPYQPSGTLGSTLRGLLEPALTVDLTAAPTDRSVPASINFDEDRLQAVYELLDAWAAEATVTPAGVFQVTPSADDTTVDVTLSRDSTVIRAAGGSSREDGYNAVVARGTTADGGIVQGVAYEARGPKKYGGLFNPLPVPYFFSSPLLTTLTQCNAAAATVLRRMRRTAAQQYQVEAVIDPRLQLADVAALAADGYTASPCTVESIRLPYTPDTSMTLGLRKVAT